MSAATTARQWYIDPDDDDLLCPQCSRSLRRVPLTGLQEGRIVVLLICPSCHPEEER